jgi:hypothetical protein
MVLLLFRLFILVARMDDSWYGLMHIVSIDFVLALKLF